jgi:hypothetical protein
MGSVKSRAFPAGDLEGGSAEQGKASGDPEMDFFMNLAASLQKGGVFSLKKARNSHSSSVNIRMIG